MTKPHDLAFSGFSRDFETFGHTGPFHQQGVISGSGEALWKTLENIGALVQDRRRLAVHEPIGADDLAAEIMTDRLGAEADPENGFFTCECTDHCQRDAGFGRGAGSGRDQHAVGVECQCLIGSDLVIPEYALLHAQLTEVLDEVEGEGIEIIDDEKHPCIYRRVDMGVKRAGREWITRSNSNPGRLWRRFRLVNLIGRKKRKNPSVF